MSGRHKLRLVTCSAKQKRTFQNYDHLDDAALLMGKMRYILGSSHDATKECTKFLFRLERVFCIHHLIYA